MILKILFDKEKVNEEQDVPERTQVTRFLGPQFLCLKKQGTGLVALQGPFQQETGLWS